MNKYKNYIIPGLILLLVLSFMLSFRAFLLEYFIMPIALLCWGVWRIIASVDQNTYWVILIVICGLLTLRLIPFKQVASNPVYHYAYRPPGRMAHWRNLMTTTPLQKNDREQLRNHLKELVVTVSMLSGQSDKSEVEEIVAEKIESLPITARQYLFPSDEQNGLFSMNWPLPHYAGKWGRKKRFNDNTMIAEILHWMETELEIDNEK